MTQTEALKQLREVHAIQGRDGCWDIDDYMLGLYNGLELALSIVENRECRYKNRPKPERTWVGLTDEEIKAFDTWHDNREEEVGWCNPTEIVAYIEAKLKDKNTKGQK